MNKPMLRITLAALAVCALSFPALADDPSCMRVDCLGMCASKEEMKGKPIPMLCLANLHCYRDVECTVLEDGKCGWRKTPELDACLAKPVMPISPSNQ